jgi:hypothetical protein
MMTSERFGPMHGQIEMLYELCDQLDEPAMKKIADAYKYRGGDDAKYAWRAARAEDREKQVGAAAHYLSSSVSANGFGYDQMTVVLCGFAARDLGTAVATRDLIGKHFYGQSDYDRLVYPWRAAFPEVA